MISEEKRIELYRLAVKAMSNAYSPYSNYNVGAALLCDDGTIYTGCNIENASYGATNCAERTAIFKAVSEGKRDFQSICIVGGMNGVLTDYAYPCGICRQVMSEFCNPEKFIVLVAKSEDDYRSFMLKELLPYSFSGDSMS